jgi:hypothetical protein
MDRTNDRTSRGQYSMRFKLVHKQSKEVVDTTEQKEKNTAWTYFYLRKQIPNRDDFNRLYEVKKDDRN